MPYDCFISYASPDLMLAEDLYASLVGEGFKVWFDKQRLEPGFNWHREIESGCENSRVFLPILTPRWKQSDWTKFETYAAEAVIPLICEGTWAEVSTPPLERFQAERLNMFASDPDRTRLFATLRRQLAQPAPLRTKRITHLHYLPNPHFTGRERELIRIHEELHTNPRAVLTQGRVRAIAAMGGVGKTTLARHYAEKFWRCYTQIFWVDARVGMEAEFSHIHDILFPGPAARDMKEAEKAARALEALCDSEARLLILDNAEDEKSVRAWIPKTGNCHTLITSRYSDWPPAIKTVYLSVLDKEPSVTFLQSRTGRQTTGEEHQACEALAEKLGYLPLALEQAAAYIEQQGEAFGFADYLHEYENATCELLAEGVLGSTEYPDSVITTWKPTVNKLSPGARAMLRLSSFMDATPIPIKLFTDGAATLVKWAADFGMVEEPTNGEHWVRSEVHHLKSYSMIRSDGKSILLHPLLQVVEVLTLQKADADNWFERAADFIYTNAPEATWRQENRTAWQMLVPHAEKLAARGRSGAKLKAVANLFDAIADVYSAGGNTDRAIPFERVALEWFTELLGPDDPMTLTVQFGLAHLLWNNNEAKESVEIHRKVLEARTRVLGPDHYDTHGSQHELGCALLSLQRPDEAEPYLRRAIEGYKVSRGEKHRDTLTALQDLAHLRSLRADNDGAEKLLREALDGYVDTIGYDHLDTLRTLGNLGILLGNVGRLEEAETLLQEAVQRKRNVLGPEHADTLLTISSLAEVLAKRKKWQEAEQQLRGLAELSEAAFGREHPRTLRAMNSLGRHYFSRSNYAAADSVFSELVRLANRPGANRADLASYFFNCGNAKLSLDLYADAISLLRRSLVLHTETHGQDNEQTLNAMRDLANALDKSGEEAEAEQLRRQILERTAQNPNASPLTLRQLARECYLLGEVEKAEELLRRVLKVGFEVASNHCHMARLKICAGQDEEAREELRLAKENLADAPTYVLPRILTLETLFVLLERGDPSPLVQEIDAALKQEGARSEWDMEPVFERVKPLLTQEDFALFHELVDRCCGRDLSGGEQAASAKAKL